MAVIMNRVTLGALHFMRNKDEMAEMGTVKGKLHCSAKWNGKGHCHDSSVCGTC